MKKLLLCLPLLALFAAAFPGCSKQRQWNHDQRKAMREALRDYRKMVYLDDLTDAEFVLFTDQVAGTLENAYPVYVEFIQMEGVDDTVDMVVVTEIVDELNAAARHMRHIFPYNTLAEGLLQLLRPEGQRHLPDDGSVLQRHPRRHDRHVPARPVAEPVRQRSLPVGRHRDRHYRNRDAGPDTGCGNSQPIK